MSVVDKVLKQITKQHVCEDFVGYATINRLSMDFSETNSTRLTSFRLTVYIVSVCIIFKNTLQPKF